MKKIIIWGFMKNPGVLYTRQSEMCAWCIAERDCVLVRSWKSDHSVGMCSVQTASYFHH